MALGVVDIDVIRVQTYLHAFADQAAVDPVGVVLDPDRTERAHPHLQPLAVVEPSSRQPAQHLPLLGQLLPASGVALAEHRAQEAGILGPGRPSCGGPAASDPAPRPVEGCVSWIRLSVAEPVPLAEGLYEALEERRSLRNLIPFHVSWSPDGNTIAFTTRWAEINNQISVWTIRSDGSELRHVFEQDFSYPDGDALPPTFFGISWSPSGEQLVIPAASYSQKFNKFSVRDKIGLIAIDGIELGAIETSVFNEHAGGIDWAGERIYFTDYEVNLLSVFTNFEIRFTSDEGSDIDSLGVGFNPGSISRRNNLGLSAWWTIGWPMGRGYQFIDLPDGPRRTERNLSCIRNEPFMVS